MSEMYDFKRKLIYFDSAYYLTTPLPLAQRSRSDKDTVINKSDLDLLHSLFRDTNRDDLMKYVKSIHASCEICNIMLPTTKHVISHVFSQSHLDKYTHERGYISSIDFMFWRDLLSIFPKDRKRFTRKEQLDRFKLISTTPLSSRSHWTVEVSSAVEQETALCIFASKCFSEGLRFVISDGKKGEVERVVTLILSKFPGSKSLEVDGGDYMYLAYVLGPHSRSSDVTSMVFMRPPAPNAMDASRTMAVTVRHATSSMILINGREQRDAFRAFEKKCMHSDETPLPIYNVTALRNIMKAFRVEPKKTMKTIAGCSIASLPSRSITSSAHPQATVTRAAIPWATAGMAVKDMMGPTTHEPVREKQDDSETDTKSIGSTEPSKRDKPATVPSARNLKLVVRKGKKYYEEVKKSVPNMEEWMENIPTINEDDVKDRPKFSVFVPFDKEMGNDVKEIIDMMTESG